LKAARLATTSANHPLPPARDELRGVVGEQMFAEAIAFFDGMLFLIPFCAS
jgi:hypothetical protein